MASSQTSVMDGCWLHDVEFSRRYEMLNGYLPRVGSFQRSTFLKNTTLRLFEAESGMHCMASRVVYKCIGGELAAANAGGPALGFSDKYSCNPLPSCLRYDINAFKKTYGR